MDDPLGNPGGARGIDDVERVVLGRIERRGPGAGGGHEGVKLAQQHLVGNRQREIAQFVQLGLIDKQVDRARIDRHAPQLFGAGAGGQRRGAAPGADRGKIDQGIGIAGGAKDRHRLAALQAIGLEPRGDPLDPVGHFAPRQRFLPVVERRGIAAIFAPGRDQAGEGTEFCIELGRGIAGHRDITSRLVGFVFRLLCATGPPLSSPSGGEGFLTVRLPLKLQNPQHL